MPNFYDALADELNARTNQIDADWYALKAPLWSH